MKSINCPSHAGQRCCRASRDAFSSVWRVGGRRDTTRAYAASVTRVYVCVCDAGIRGASRRRHAFDAHLCGALVVWPETSVSDSLV
jgi:hypothetical protein